MTFRRWLRSQSGRPDHIGALVDVLNEAPASAPTRRVWLTVDRLREHADALGIPVWHVYAAASEYEKHRAGAV